MIIFDLDGTLADCEHRRHFVDVHKAVEKGIAYEEEEADFGGVQFKGYFLESDPDKKWKPDWKAFYEACDQDKYIIPSFETLRSLRKNFEIQIWSGRCESVRKKTEEWLIFYAPYLSWIDKIPLKMRPIGDSTPDDVLKERWIDEALSQGKRIDFVFDDRPKVIRMYKRRGIFVFNCAQDDEEF